MAYEWYEHTNAVSYMVQAATAVFAFVLALALGWAQLTKKNIEHENEDLRTKVHDLEVVIGVFRSTHRDEIVALDQRLSERIRKLEAASLGHQTARLATSGADYPAGLHPVALVGAPTASATGLGDLTARLATIGADYPAGLHPVASVGAPTVSAAGLGHQTARLATSGADYPTGRHPVASVGAPTASAAARTLGARTPLLQKPSRSLRGDARRSGVTFVSWSITTKNKRGGGGPLINDELAP